MPGFLDGPQVFFLFRHRPELGCRSYLRTVGGAKVFSNNPLRIPLRWPACATSQRQWVDRKNKNGGKMKTVRLMRVVAVMLAAFIAATASAQALNSGAQPIALNATLGESLTLTLSAATRSEE